MKIKILLILLPIIMIGTSVLATSEMQEQTKTLELNTNNANTVLASFPQTIEYDDGEFKGELSIDENSLQITTIKHGTYEQLLTLSKEYQNLDKSDLDYIPKDFIYNGYRYYLTNCIWEITGTEDIADITMPKTYLAKTTYKAIKNVEYPYTYECTVNYEGEVTKTSNDKIQYTLTYQEEKPAAPQEKKQIPILPVLGGTGLFIVLIFFLLPNAKITNYAKGKYKVVKHIRVSAINPKVDLRYLPNATTNVFAIVFNKRIANKLHGGYVKILTPKNTIQKAIIKNSIEINI